MKSDILRRTFSSLKHRNFRLFFTGQTISLVGNWMQQTALSWLIYDLTGSKFLLGFIAALGSLPMLFLSIMGGVIADRYRKRRVLMLVQSLAMVFAFILAGLIMFKVIQIWHIFVLAVLSGIVFAIDMPVRQSFFIDIVEKKDLMNAIALNSTIVNGARIMGPALAGIVMVNFGISFCFILNGLSFIAILYALFKITANENIPQENIESVMDYALNGFKYVHNNKLIRELMLLMVVVGIFGWSYSILFPAIAKDFFSKGEQGYALMVSANGLGSLVGALIIAYLGNSPKKRQFVNFGIYLFCIMTAFIAFSKIYWLSLILISLAGVGLVTYFSSTTTLIQSSVEDSIRGRVMGIWALVFGGMIPLGSIFAGTCSQILGIQRTLLISAIICFVFTLSLSILSGKRKITG